MTVSTTLFAAAVAASSLTGVAVADAPIAPVQQIEQVGDKGTLQPLAASAVQYVGFAERAANTSGKVISHRVGVAIDETSTTNHVGRAIQVQVVNQVGTVVKTTTGYLESRIRNASIHGYNYYGTVKVDYSGLPIGYYVARVNYYADGNHSSISKGGIYAATETVYVSAALAQ